MFSRKKNKARNERILYEARPNMILGCKNVIWGIVTFAIIMYISAPIKKAIIDLQTYYISFVKFGFMGFISLAFITIILLDIVYIIWQLLSWYAIRYTITNERIIIKKGIIRIKKTYMPFRSIQDIDLSQNIIEKLFNVGTVAAYSAYDNNDVKLANISEPREVEELLFEKMNENRFANDSRYPLREENYDEDYNYNKKSREFHNKRRHYDDYSNDEYYNSRYDDRYGDSRGYHSDEYNHKYDDRYGDSRGYHSDEYNHRYDDRFEDSRDYRSSDRYDDYEERFDNDYDDSRYYREHNEKPYYDESYNQEQPSYKQKRSYNKYEYEEYPNYERKQKKYDYEYYDDSLEDNINHAVNNIDKNQHNRRNKYEDDEPYYNDDDYDDMENFYRNNREKIYIPPDEEPSKQSKKSKDKSDDVVQRHFDKFNR